MDSKKTLVQVVDLLEKQMDEMSSLSAPGRPGDLGTAETARNLCMPEPVQGTAVLRKFVTIQDIKIFRQTLFFSESIGLAEDLFYLCSFTIYSRRSAESPPRRSQRILSGIRFPRTICSVHTVVDFKVCASKRNTVFQMMHIRSAADRKWFAWVFQ